jgi:hypothetical protein
MRIVQRRDEKKLHNQSRKRKEQGEADKLAQHVHTEGSKGNGTGGCLPQTIDPPTKLKNKNEGREKDSSKVIPIPDRKLARSIFKQ